MTAASLTHLPAPAQRRPLGESIPVLPLVLRRHPAVALLRRCDRPFRQVKKRWPVTSMANLELVQKASTS